MVIEWFQHFNIANLNNFLKKLAIIFCYLLSLLPTQEPENLLKGLKKLYRPWNSFQLFDITNFIDFFEKLQFFSKLSTFIVLIYGFPAPRARKPPIGFNDRLLNFYYRPWNSFQLFNITNFIIFLTKLVIFFKFCHFLVYPASRAKESPLAFNNRLLYTF